MRGERLEVRSPDCENVMASVRTIVQVSSYGQENFEQKINRDARDD